MKLFLTPRSPFARRIRLALKLHQIAFESIPVDLFSPSSEFLEVNPLGLAPALEVSPGLILVDSPMILDELEVSFNLPIWPKDSQRRIRVKYLSGIATGAMAAIVSRYLESLKKSPDESWREEDIQTVRRSLEVLHRPENADDLVGTQAQWDVGILLEYIDLRASLVEWRKDYPKLASVLSACQKAPEFTELSPPAL
jgi:glutathione S-transferase